MNDSYLYSSFMWPTAAMLIARSFSSHPRPAVYSRFYSPSCFFSWNREHEEAWIAMFRFINFFLKLGYGGIQLIHDERIRIQVNKSIFVSANKY